MLVLFVLGAPACGGEDLYDYDGDGTVDADDCDPQDSSIYPGAHDECHDGVDSDCDGLDCPEDQDNDSFTHEEGDCDDNDPEIYPGAEDEHGDTIDSNCDGIDGVDEDGDEYPGNADESSGLLDCDDSDPDVNPGVEETCGNGVDDNCDGLLNGCGFEPVMSLADADATLVGEAQDCMAGWDVESSGDLTGDGVRDLLVGSPGCNGAGRAYIVPGDVSGILDLSAADVMIDGEGPGDNAGAVVGSGGDVTGDGAPDLLVSAWGYGGGLNQYQGAVYLITTPLTDPYLTLASHYTARIIGAGNDDELGAAAAIVGDVNGDGDADVVVGAPGADSSDGEAYLLLGPLPHEAQTPWDADVVFQPEYTGQRLGWGMLEFGDQDGDGLQDIVIGAPNTADSGVAYLMGAPLDSTVVVASISSKARIDLGGSLLGLDMAAGHLDDDGELDLVATAWSDDRYPLTFVQYGPVQGTLDIGNDAGAVLTGGEALPSGSDYHLDSGVAILGDTDGDEVADLLVGCPYDPEGTYAGAAFLHTGPLAGDLGLSGGIKFVGTSPWSRTGGAVAAAGDLTGDSLGDFLIGAPGHDGEGDNAGEVYVVWGVPGL